MKDLRLGPVAAQRGCNGGCVAHCMVVLKDCAARLVCSVGRAFGSAVGRQRHGVPAAPESPATEVTGLTFWKYY